MLTSFFYQPAAITPIWPGYYLIDIPRQSDLRFDRANCMTRCVASSEDITPDPACQSGRAPNELLQAGILGGFNPYCRCTGWPANFRTPLNQVNETAQGGGETRRHLLTD